MSSSMNLGVLSTTPNIINNNNNNNNEASLDKDNLICGNMNNILSGGNNCNNNNNNNVNNNNIQQISSSQLSHLNMSNNFDLSSPMIFRSMSDASAIRRNLQMNNNHNNNLASYQRQFANLYGPTSWSTANDQQQQQQQYADLATIISPGNSLLSSMPSGSSRLMSLMNRNSFLQTHQNEFNSSSTVTTTSIDTSIASNTPAAASTTATINGQLRLNINVNNPNNNTVDEDDYDLNIVFDEIDALQHKGLNEPEDDNSTAPLQLLSSPTTNDNQSTTAVSTQQPSQTNAPTKQLSHIEIDGKIYKYDPELYDPADITLMNEKFSMNARYLRDFRCEQCPLFLQHKCTQHKPFTCFNWHFANQRRRRPLRKRDGTFNYSPDNYCIKYDDTTGFCPDGDDCPYLHRTAGDTERRYHLRYYKTGMCVYETDERGYCVKNGAHCAFAHGSHDLRMAVFDIREQQQQQQPTNGSNNLQCDENGQLIVNGDHHLLNGGCIANNINGCQSTIVNGQTQQQQPSSSLSSSTQHMYDKDRNAINEDPRWQNTAFVLAFYKTELCKRPPRVCRQGYACPQYHNNKDRRRSPKKFKYRSTPCPSVKQGDEWGDPSNCENQDDCIYCHTRTEQQFHPEIYKSTKCNDIQQSGHCPRGPFCAFAHSESTDEINTAKEFATNPNTELPPSIAANVVVVTSSTTPTSTTGKSNNNLHHHNQHHYNNTSPLEIVRANSYSRGSSSTAATANHLNGHNQNAMIIASSLPEHVEFNGFDLQPQHHLAQNTELNNSMKNNQNNNILGPIARPRSFSTSNTNTKTSPLIANWLESKNNLLNHKHQQQQQQSLFATASSCSSLFSVTNAESMQNLNNAANNVVSNGPFIANFTFEQQQQFNSILNNNNNNNNTNTNNNHDLNFDELDNFVAKTSNAIENCHIQQQQPPSSSESFGSILRRGSYSFNESEPINIPRIATNNDAQQQHRSTSAAGFNISPPTVAAAATNSNQLAMAVAAAAASPIGSAFMPANNRQNSLPNNQTIFDQFVNGTNAATTAASAVANNQQQNAAAMSAALMEMQRLKEENNAAKNRIVESQEAIQQVVQFFRIQLNEAQKREKLYEKQRDEALSRLDLREKELIESSTFHKQRISELSSMSRNQLLQLKQKLSQDLSYIEEALKTAATTPTATSGNV